MCKLTVESIVVTSVIIIEDIMLVCRLICPPSLEFLHESLIRVENTRKSSA